MNKRVLSGVAVLVLALTSVAVVAAAEAGPAYGVGPRLDADNAPFALATFDESTAREIDRDEYSVTEVDASGLHRTALSDTPMSVWRDGTWVPASAEVVAQSTGDFAAPAHPLEPVLAGNADDAALIRVGGDDGLAISLEGTSGVEGRLVATDVDGVERQELVYDDAVDGSDLVLTVTPSSVHQKIVLESAPTSQLAYSWMISAPGLSLESGENGELVFLDAAGNVAYVLPGPVMWDSASPEGGVADSPSSVIAYETVEVGEGEWRVTARPDNAWLGDPERVYPVFVDPDVYPGSTVHTYKENNWTYNYGTTVRIGNSKETSTCCAWRTVMRYDFNPYFYKRVTGAVVVANWTYGTTTTQPAALYWATAFSFAGNGGWITSFDISTSGSSGSQGVFDMVASYLNNADLYSYVMLVGQENDAIYGRKDLSTYVYFTWVERPTITGVTAPSPITPAGQPLVQVDRDNVVVEATGTHSTPGASQVFKYAFTTTTPGAVSWTSDWVATGPYRLPDTVLTPGADYTYSVQTKDTASGSPIVTAPANSTWKFHVRNAPLAPSNVTVDAHAMTATAPVVSADRTPTVTATVSTAEAGDVWALFTVKQNGIVVVDSLPGTHYTAGTGGGSGTSSAELPYALTPGATYTIEVQSFDGHLASTTFTAPGTFSGPPRELREIPGNHDNSTGATS